MDDNFLKTPDALDNVNMIFISGSTVKVYDEESELYFAFAQVATLSPYEGVMRYSDIQITEQGVWLILPFPVALELNGSQNLVVIDEGE